MRLFHNALRIPPALPKRQRTGAIQDASRGSGATGQRASVLDYGGPPLLFSAPPNHSPFSKTHRTFQYYQGEIISRRPAYYTRHPNAPEDRRSPRRFARFGSHRQARQRLGLRRPSAAFLRVRQTIHVFHKPIANSNHPGCSASTCPGRVCSGLSQFGR